MWLVGALIAACGTAVYIELGTVYLLPKSKFWGPNSQRFSRDSPGVEARRTTLNTYIVVPSSWRRVPMLSLSLYWQAILTVS